MGKIETRKRDCRRSVGIKYKIKPLKKMAHSRDKRTGMNRQQNLCLIPVRLYPFFRNGFILRWWRKICEVKGGEAMQRYFRKCTDPQMLDQKSNDWRSIFLWLNIVLNLKRK